MPHRNLSRDKEQNVQRKYQVQQMRFALSTHQPVHGHACLYFGHAFSSIPCCLLNLLPPSLSPPLHCLSLSAISSLSLLPPSLSLSSHFSSSFSPELNRGVASHLRRKGGREGEEESSRGHLPLAGLSAGSPLVPVCRVDVGGVGGEGGETEGVGEGGGR